MATLGLVCCSTLTDRVQEIGPCYFNSKGVIGSLLDLGSIYGAGFDL